MGAKCGASSKKKPIEKENKNKDIHNNHSFIHEVPYSEQEKEEANYDPRNSRLRLNHSMHKSSIIVVNEETKEIKPVDLQVEFNLRFEDIVTITKENINLIYKVEPQIMGKIYLFMLINILLAHGNFGQLRKATMTNFPGKIFAVKSIPLKKRSKADCYLLKTEFEIMKVLDFPNIVKYYEAYLDDNYVHLVMEYLSGGELFDRIISETKILESEVCKIMRKIFSAVNYLHLNGICHRDLKLENFIFSQKGDDSELKIIDFGLSKQYNPIEVGNLNTVVGTALYVAPEVLQGKYDYRCDYWSLGVVMFTLLGGYPPFFGENNKQIFKKVMEAKLVFDSPVWSRVSKQGKELISKLIVKDPESRITAKQALDHPWFDFFKEPETEKKIETSTIHNLRNYKKLSAFKKEVMRVVFSLMNENEIIKEKCAFRHMDLDNDGKISINELKSCFEEFGFHDDDIYIEHLIKDINGNENADTISYTNFMMASLDLNKYHDSNKINAVYDYFNIDKNSGFITMENFKRALERTGKKIEDEDIKKMMGEILLGDHVSKEIFVELMMNDEGGLSPSKHNHSFFLFFLYY